MNERTVTAAAFTVGLLVGSITTKLARRKYKTYPALIRLTVDDQLEIIKSVAGAHGFVEVNPN